MLILWTQLVKSLHFEKKGGVLEEGKEKKTFQIITNTLGSSQNNKINKKKPDKNNIWEETPFPVAVCLFYYFIMNFYKEISYEVLRCELF